MKRRLAMILCLLLCFTFLPLTVSAEAPGPSVRVLLRRLALTDRADLILDGAYTAKVGGQVLMSFPRKAEVTITIRSGELYLFYEGMAQRLGGEVTFVRNASGDDDGRTGIRFDKNGGLYPGDLRLTVRDGILYPVCTMPVEEYLLGVVPYEMSEYFPLEALKVQAICARTYALNKLGANADYDLVDTTNDQVFKGVNHNYVNAKRAVQETAGIVGTYKGKLAICYYSASNGGQTERVGNVWSGRGDWEYYQVVDDPYDVENPESTVRTARIAKNGDIREGFKAILFSYVLPKMLRQGYVATAENFRIDEITAMSLGAPAFEPPNRQYTELTLTFRWSGRRWLEPEAAATPIPDATTEEEFYFFATPTPTETPVPPTTPEAPPPPPPPRPPPPSRLPPPAPNPPPGGVPHPRPNGDPLRFHPRRRVHHRHRGHLPRGDRRAAALRLRRGQRAADPEGNGHPLHPGGPPLRPWRWHEPARRPVDGRPVR